MGQDFEATPDNVDGPPPVIRMGERCPTGCFHDPDSIDLLTSAPVAVVRGDSPDSDPMIATGEFTGQVPGPVPSAILT